MAESESQTATWSGEYVTSISEKDPSKARLDHIIILLPYKDLISLPEWLTSSFTISPGGQHADKKTENKLILFFDGSYIELIAFINDDPKHKEGHRWGEMQPGIIDFALTTNGDAKANWEAIQERLSHVVPDLAVKFNHHTDASFEYAPPVSGGRLRPDGVEVKWEVTTPKHVQRGELPFFCHDVTPRDRRVPFSKEACTHPCKAYGVKQIVVSVPGGGKHSIPLGLAYSAVLEEEMEVLGSFPLETVTTVQHAWRPRLLVTHANEDEVAAVASRGSVLSKLVLGGFSTPGGREGKTLLDADESLGRIILDLQPYDTPFAIGTAYREYLEDY